ncbi:B3 domain-containing protein [Cucumis melo var. makuwa]|uniref:B3 domain-containing protein At3g25182-like n=2 Tax=Cucumis melo TaxID=3656 RepID=A0A1S3BCJ5_CUCME|nr:B3 domain-containing protein At3g25182-like [Cucumis melo]KAA0065235.1 B3 domain-containing protein [Cucumis melo var. makuwa]
MESNNHVFKTLDLISLFAPDRSTDGSSESDTGSQISSEKSKNSSGSDDHKPRMETRRRKASEKRKKNDNSPGSDHRPKKERRKDMVFSKTIEMSAMLRDRIDELDGFDIQYVTQKRLQDTDMNKNHGRLLIPFKKLRNDFASEEEKQLLKQHDQEDLKNKNGMTVLIIDPQLRNRHIELKMWKVGQHDSYCLMSKWNSFVQENSLESGDYIQLWSFRSNNIFIVGHQSQVPVNSNLCFALVKLDISEGIFKFI